MQVRSLAAKSRAESNRHCVVATRGGEQRNENDQSVTTSRDTETGELDSVGVDGRAFERVAKPVERAIGAEPNRRTAGRDGRSLSDIIADVNGSLRGWSAYFQHSKANVFVRVDGYVRRRLRSLLQWRLDGVGQGIGATINAGRTHGLRAVGC